MLEEEFQGLHTNQRLLVEELQSRGVEVTLLSKELELLEAEYEGHKELILDRDSSINPYASSVIAGDKYLTKRLLQRHDISVPQGRQFGSDDVDQALLYAQGLGLPVVVKPVFGSHGYDVHMDLENLCDAKEAIESVIENTGRRYLVEEQFEGKEYRVFITRDGNYAILHRDPSHVIGDGKSTIEELAESETDRRMNPRITCLCPIMIDDMAKEYLASQSKSLDSIPQKDEKVYLRHNSNVAMGATFEDYTDKVHPSVIEIARKTLEAIPGLPYAGIDFLSKDIAAEQTPDMYRIIEVNTVPGIHMHMRPGSGVPRDVAGYIVDMMYPETVS